MNKKNAEPGKLVSGSMKNVRLASLIVIVGFVSLDYITNQVSEFESINTVEVVKVETSDKVVEELDSLEAKPTVEAKIHRKNHDTGCEQYRGILAQYDWDVDLMMAIMQAESSCNPEAVGDKTLTFQKNGRTYGYSKSLLQIRQLPGREHCDTFDPDIIVKCGYDIWKSQGYNAWSVYSNGMYKKFL